MPTIQDVLDAKGFAVVTIEPDRSVQEAVDLIVSKKIGSVLVREADGPLLGILTERDVLRIVREPQGDLQALKVREHMTRNLITAKPDDEVSYALSIMTRMRFRRMPVVHEGHLTGIVSIGDLVKAVVEEKEAEVRALHNYIAGSPVA
jgi:CBS domain-containing protein